LPKWISETAWEALQSCSLTLRKARKEILEKGLLTRVNEAKQDNRVDMKLLKLHVGLSMRKNGYSVLLDSLVQSTGLGKRFERVGVDMAVPIPPTPKRHRSWDKLFDPIVFETEAKEEMGIILLDFERSLVLWDAMAGDLTWKYVWDVFRVYLSTAKEFYKGT
jgi:hypothetical protein